MFENAISILGSLLNKVGISDEILQQTINSDHPNLIHYKFIVTYK